MISFLNVRNTFGEKNLFTRLFEIYFELKNSSNPLSCIMGKNIKIKINENTVICI